MRRTLASLRGLKAMVASAFAFAVMAALIKTAARGVPAAQVVFVRNLVHAAIFVPIWWATTDRSLGSPRLLVLRGLLGLAALEAYAYTLAILPLADAWILQALNPVFVSILAPRLLHEPSPRSLWVALVLGFGGAALVVRPGFHVAWWPGAIGVVGGLASALAYMTVRRLGARERPLTVVMAFPVIAGPLSFPFAWAVWRTPTLLEWAAMVGAALAAAAGQMLLTIGLQGARAAPATTATYVGFVFASAIGWLVFGEAPAWTTLAGAVAIVVGVALVARDRSSPSQDPPLDPVLDPEPDDTLRGPRPRARVSSRGARAGR